MVQLVLAPALAESATVSCPLDYPFRVSLAYGAAIGVIGSADHTGQVFTGEGLVALSRLGGVAQRDGPIAMATLTISY